MSMRSMFAVLACLLAFAPGLCAQLVALPHATGSLTPASEWTVLRTADMEQKERESDPRDDPARALLQSTIAGLQQAERLTEHVVFHAAGATAGTVRLVNAYSAAGHATADELCATDRVETIRGTLQPELQRDGITAVYHSHERSSLFPIGSLVLHFDLTENGRQRRFDHHIVPAGERLQYFDVTYYADDLEATGHIEGLLRSFDGASEDRDDTLQNMIIGGIAGGIAGIAFAVMRNRRHRRLLAMAGSDPQAG